MIRLTNAAYDLLKPIALIWIPAIATLYVGVAVLWNLGDVSAVEGTLSAIDAFLGAVLHLSANPTPATPVTDGVLTVDKTDPDKDKLVFKLETDLDGLADKKTVTFAVTQTV